MEDGLLYGTIENQEQLERVILDTVKLFNNTFNHRLNNAMVFYQQISLIAEDNPSFSASIVEMAERLFKEYGEMKRSVVSLNNYVCFKSELGLNGIDEVIADNHPDNYAFSHFSDSAKNAKESYEDFVAEYKLSFVDSIEGKNEVLPKDEHEYRSSIIHELRALTIDYIEALEPFEKMCSTLSRIWTDEIYQQLHQGVANLLGRLKKSRTIDFEIMNDGTGVYLNF